MGDGRSQGSYLGATWVASLLLLVLLMGVGSACGGPKEGEPAGQSGGEPATARPGSPSPLAAGSPLAQPAYPKLDALLNRLVAERGRRPDADVAASAPVSRGDAVGVSIRVSGDPGPLRGFLEANGATVARVAPGVVEAYVPLALLPSLAARPDVLRVGAIHPPRPAGGTPP